jgi:hypothetical protein
MYERTGIAPASVAPATFQQLILQVYPVATFVVAVGSLGKFQAKDEQKLLLHLACYRFRPPNPVLKSSPDR